MVAEEPKAIAIIHNIADKYRESGISTDGNMLWFAADFASYEKLYPERESILSDAEKQACLDKIAETAETATKPGDLAKLIIALRALGYDAKTVYNKDGVLIDVVSKLIALVDAGDSAVTNIYTLPYVIIALGQGEDYATEEQINALLTAAVSSKASWQSTQWGTDAATPMILALAPYCAENEDIKTAVDEAVTAVKAHRANREPF